MRIRVVQGSAEWLALRKTKVTSTDIAVCMGVGYKSRNQLLRQKLDYAEADVSNEKMELGRKLEPIARKQFCLSYGDIFSEEVHVSDAFPWAMASLDGINLDDSEVIEIKCGEKAWNDFKLGVVSDAYICQVQWHLFVTGASVCHFIVYWEGQIMYKTFKRNDEYIEKLKEAGYKFYEEMQSELVKELEIEERSEEAWQEAAEKLLFIKGYHKKYDDLLKEAKADVLSLLDGKGGKGYGITAKKMSRIGSISPDLMLEDGIDATKYRNPTSYFWEVRIDKCKDKE